MDGNGLNIAGCLGSMLQKHVVSHCRVQLVPILGASRSPIIEPVIRQTPCCATTANNQPPTHTSLIAFAPYDTNIEIESDIAC